MDNYPGISKGKALNDYSTRIALQEIKGFPYQTYVELIAKYQEAESWFYGTRLSEANKNNEAGEPYPLEINPLPSMCTKHAHVLFGESKDDSRPLVYPRLRYSSDSEKELATFAEEVIYDCWWENHGSAALLQNGIMSQIYGGCIFKLTWPAVKDPARMVQLRIEIVHPKNFIAMPDGNDNYSLQSAWFIDELPSDVAKQYGYKGEDNTAVLKVEHWTKTEYEITLNGKTASFNNQEMKGPNPYGFVPGVYIPHLRFDGFYGINAFDTVLGILRELNLRFGDYGDAINDDAHPLLAIKNVNGSPKVVRIARDINALDLGNTTGITGNEKEPDIKQVRSNAQASTAMDNILEKIYNQFRRDTYLPPVADGEDEGSQRSSMTLTTRFWPLLAHAQDERVFWTAGLNVLNAMILKMLAIKKANGISEKHFMRMKQVWAPLLPRDREVIVAEAVQRAASNLGSIETLMNLIGDVEDTEEEKERILEWLKEVSKAQSFGQPAPFGNSPGGSSEKRSIQADSQPQAAAKKKDDK